MLFFETSAKTSDHVSSAFMSLTKKLMESKDKNPKKTTSGAAGS